MTGTDPELGPVRRCRRCGEWWPDDGEFFEVAARAGSVHRPAGNTRGTPKSYARRHDVRRATCRACRAEQRLAFASAGGQND